MSFTLDVKKFADGFIDGAEVAVRGTAIKVFENIVLATPVDEGRVRGNWFATGLKPSRKVNENIRDKSGTATVNAITDKVLTLEEWHTFTLTNNLPYALVLENGGYPDPVKNGTYIGWDKAAHKPIYEKRSKSGYSTQAPNGMVRIAIMRANRELTIQARKYLPK
jgi:hypothetical protein